MQPHRPSASFCSRRASLAQRLLRRRIGPGAYSWSRSDLSSSSRAPAVLPTSGRTTWPARDVSFPCARGVPVGAETIVAEDQSAKVGTAGILRFPRCAGNGKRGNEGPSDTAPTPDPIMFRPASWSLRQLLQPAHLAGPTAVAAADRAGGVLVVAQRPHQQLAGLGGVAHFEQPLGEQRLVLQRRRQAGQLTLIRRLRK